MDISGYANALLAAGPKAIIPDIGPGGAGDETPKIGPIPGLAPAAPGAIPNQTGDTSFRDTVKALLSDVNDKMQTSDQNARDLASGKTNDVNKVVTSAEEANLAFQYTLAVRQKLLDAYTEISRMQV